MKIYQVLKNYNIFYFNNRIFMDIIDFDINEYSVIDQNLTNAIYAYRYWDKSIYGGFRAL